MPLGPLVVAALELRKEVRQEYELLLEELHGAAETQCNGQLVNERGRQKGVTSWELFTRNSAAMREAYATEELVEWFRLNPYPTYQQYEESRARDLLPSRLWP